MSPATAWGGDERGEGALTSFWSRDDGSIKSMEQLARERKRQISALSANQYEPVNKNMHSFNVINLILDDAAHVLQNRVPTHLEFPDRNVFAIQEPFGTALNSR